MSRLIVKNLPSGITDNRLRKVFGAYGTLSDVALKYRTNGNFRHFGFIGYVNESDAISAVEKLNNTYIDTAKIQVEVCKNLGETEKHKSKLQDESIVTIGKPEKRSLDDPNSSSAAIIHRDAKRQRIDKLRKVLHNPLLSEEEKILLKRVIDEPEFEQFLSAHSKAGSQHDADGKTLWGNDGNIAQHVDANQPPSDVTAASPGAESVADLAFLKAKIVKKVAAKENRATKTKNCIKLTNLPPKASKGDIKSFLAPFKILRIFRARKGAGFAYVQLEDDSAVEKAISEKNRNVLRGRQVKLVYVKEARDEAPEMDQLEKLANKKVELANEEIETVAESGRLFARNLAYSTTEEDLQKFFAQLGEVSEVHLPVDRTTQKPKGFALITYLYPEHAVAAFNKLDGTIFQGRVLHLLPAKSVVKKDEPRTNKNSYGKEKYQFPIYDATGQQIPESDTTGDVDDAEQQQQQQRQNNKSGTGTQFQQEREKETKSVAGVAHNWNTLFLSADVVTELMTKRFNTTKRSIMNGGDADDGGSSAAVRVALGEAQLVQETKKFLLEHGVNLDAFSSTTNKRSKTIIIVKNFPAASARSNVDEAKILFERFGALKTFVYPPHAVTALVEYHSPAEARAAFKTLAYAKFGTSDAQRPLYLEWAPANALLTNKQQQNTDHQQHDKPKSVTVAVAGAGESNSCVFVKSLNFITYDAGLRAHFEKVVGPEQIESAVVATKRDPNAPSNLLSMGFGFVQFKSAAAAQQAVRELQHSFLDNSKLELSFSRKKDPVIAQTEEVLALRQARQTEQQQQQQAVGGGTEKAISTKLCVRNIPFQANRNELLKLFNAMATVKNIRLPQKSDGTGQHRGFGFVEFATKADAKRCMEAFGSSTHLYGRRLVLEWAQVADDAEAEVDMLREKTAIVAERNRSAEQGQRFKKSALRDSVAKSVRFTDAGDAE